MNQLTILGCGSAMPTVTNSPSGQILEMCDKKFLIDCGEGIQLAIRQMAIHTARLYNIFISHLHGDHCFGLIGLISTLGMMGRRDDMHIYAHADLEKLLKPILDYHCKDLSYRVIFHTINPRKQEVIYEDRTLTVTTIPLKHSVPCCGFLFEEKVRTKRDGSQIIPFRFAYCSDTAYKESIATKIKGVDCLYHEATYTNEFADRAKSMLHATAEQAATIAKKAQAKKLIIGHFSTRIKDHNVLLEEAQNIFPNTELAIERKTYIFRTHYKLLQNTI